MQQQSAPTEMSGPENLTRQPVPGRMWRTSSGLLDPSTGPRPQRIDIRLPVSLSQLQQAGPVPAAPAPMQNNAFMRRQSTMEDRCWDQALAAAGLQSLTSSSLARFGIGGGLRRPRTAGAASQSRFRPAAGGVYQTPMSAPPPPPLTTKTTSTNIQPQVVQILAIQQQKQQQSLVAAQSMSLRNGAPTATDASIGQSQKAPEQQADKSKMEQMLSLATPQQPMPAATSADLLEQPQSLSLKPQEQLIAPARRPTSPASGSASNLAEQQQKQQQQHQNKHEQSKPNASVKARAQTSVVRSTTQSIIDQSSLVSSSSSSDSDTAIVAPPPRPATPAKPAPAPPQQPRPKTSPPRPTAKAKPVGSGRRKRLPSLLPSLFPGAPASLNFAAEGELLEPACLPLLERARRQLLKWRLSPATPGVVRRVVARSGFKFLAKTGPGDEFDCVESDEWLGYFGRHMKPAEFSTIREYQKVNHFPGSFALGRKDRLWQGLRRLRDKHGDFFNIAPATYVLPEDLRALRQAWDAAAAASISAASASSVASTSSLSSASTSDANLDGSDSPLWILKPPASCRGQGIRLLSKWHQVPKRRPALVQAYLNQPYLIDGNKFDLRVYVYVTSFDPLRAYVHELGLVRFASSQYDPSDPANRFAHLTNYSINKHSRSYKPSQQDGLGHKWSLQALWARLRADGHNPVKVWDSVKLVVLKALLSGQAHIANQVRLLCKRACCAHELFGFDVLLDEDLRPWLLEINVSPSLNTDTQLDNRIKDTVIADTLRLAGFRLPAPEGSASNAPNLGDFDSDDDDTDDSEEKRAAELEVAEGSQNGLSPAASANGADPPNPLPSRRLADDERAKCAFFCAPNWRRRLPRLLDGPLTPRDVRCLARAADEFQRRGGFERLAPVGGDLGLRCLTSCGGRPSYASLLLHAFASRYGPAGREGIDLLAACCRAGLLRADCSNRQLWGPPAGVR